MPQWLRQFLPTGGTCGREEQAVRDACTARLVSRAGASPGEARGLDPAERQQMERSPIGRLAVVNDHP